MIPLPTVPGGFRAVYADPAWHFSTRSGKGRDRCPDARHYQTMSLDDIKALPVREVSADDCALFLWVIDPMLQEGLAVGEAWGFTYKTVAFTWAKTAKDGDGWPIGTGYWTRANPEMCLLFTRGRPKRLNADVRQLVVSPRREHSRKPEGMHQRIERLVDGPFLEMFSRGRPRRNWTMWGDQVGKFGALSRGDNAALLRPSES